MIITARASHLPQAPRKINLVVKSIVGLPATKALDKLQFTVKRASNPIAKVLRQAIANATNNHKLDPKNLFIDTAFATKGRVLKRSMVGGRSRQKPYERTASHLTINLRSTTPKVVAKPKTEISNIKSQISNK
jgi:large subunit ribosomal protein L22